MERLQIKSGQGDYNVDFFDELKDWFNPFREYKGLCC